MAEPFALYVHVPWCRRVCPYCDFNVYARARPDDAAEAAALAAELTAWGEREPWRGRRVASLYFGGGTPSLLAPATIAAVVEAAARGFGLDDDCEVTLEANPGTIDAERLAAYTRAGMTRLSLGTQSFDAGVLRRLGRDHGPEESVAAVEAARAAGLSNVSLDLIFGVPGQTPGSFEHDLDVAVGLAPEHVSAYSLTFEEGTPFHAWRTSGRLTPVDEDVEEAMADVLAARLESAGYRRYEISSWARPGFESRHNQSYWTGRDYLGIGPGAHSFSATPHPGRRWHNERKPDVHRDGVVARGTAVAMEEALTEEVARAEAMFTGLRRVDGVEVARFRARFGVSPEESFPHLAGLVADGLVERTATAIRLTARGLCFADAVAATFMR
jgi:oxygen-independent coproporphyrinogen-3 oxidase